VADSGAGSAVADARELASQGHELEALELLSQLPSSTEVDRALPDIRRHAFAALERASGYASWPRASDAPAPPIGPRGLPEVAVAELTAEGLRAAVNTHGCLLVRGVADADEARMLAEGIDEAFAGATRRRTAEAAEREAGRRPGPFESDSPWYDPMKVPGNKAWVAGRLWVEKGAGVLLADSPLLLRRLFDLYETKGLRAVIADYLGERPVLSATKATLRRVPPDSDSHWHQDGSFLGGGLRVLNVWLALTHCGDDAPGLDVVPKRFDQVVETGSGDARFSYMVNTDTVRRVSADAPPIRPVFEPGDALLFDELFLHRTAAEPTMQRIRYSVESWFFAPSTYPDPEDQVPLVW
jgi:hypothetical protein